MMGGDSSIYSRNGVGGTSRVLEAGNDMGSRSSPGKSLRALVVFLAGFLFLLSALPGGSPLGHSQTGSEEQTDCFGRRVMLINRSNLFRRCFSVQFLLFSARLWGKPQTPFLSKRIS